MYTSSFNFDKSRFLKIKVYDKNLLKTKLKKKITYSLIKISTHLMYYMLIEVEV